MLYSKLIHKDTLYILLHAEQVYQNFNMFDKNLGYYTSELTRDTLERIGKEIQTIQRITHIIIDFYLLEENRNSYDELSSIVEYGTNNKISMSLIRINESLYGSDKNPAQKIISLSLKFNTLKKTETIIESKIYHNLLLDFNLSMIPIGDFDNYIFDLYGQTLQNKIISTYKQDNPKQYSESSNVGLPVYINIKKFIEEKDISLLGLYLLCKKSIIEGLIPDFRSKEKPIVFFQSIVGSYLASVFSKIACLDMAYLDHIGPKNKLYRTIQKDIFKNQNNTYLLISDVVCMGTEIQIAKSIISHEGSKVVGILPIVDVKVIDKEPNDKEPKICSLFTLTSGNNENINYQITTNF